MFSIESIHRNEFNNGNPLVVRTEFAEHERTKSENYFSAAIHNAIRDFTRYGSIEVLISRSESPTCQTITISNKNESVQIQWNWS